MLSSDQVRGYPPNKHRARINSLIKKPARLSRFVVRTVALEFSTIFIVAALSLRFYYSVKLHAEPPFDLYISDSFVIAAITALTAAAFRQYTNIASQSLRWYISSVLGAILISFSLFLSLLFVLKIANEYSRGAFFVQILSVSFAVVCIRVITHTRLRAAIASNQIEARRVVVIGRNSHCDPILQRLANNGLRVQSVIPFPPPTEKNADCLGDVFRQIARQCRPFRPDDILVLATERDFADVERLTEALSELPASIHMLPIGLHNVLNFSKFSELGLMPTIQLAQQPLSQIDILSKRAFDLVAAVIGLTFLSPLLVTVAALIALDGKGRPIFRQLRHGFNNEPIRVFKFRTMNVVENGVHFTQATKDDARVTPLGRALRKSNIDELPQLLNVLLGEMSLVGPRPHPIKLNERFEANFSFLSRRHNVKPGLTGWAQVNGCRGETDTLEKMKKRLEHDLYYIDNWSFLFDIQIILMTFLSKEAYNNAY